MRGRGMLLIAIIVVELGITSCILSRDGKLLTAPSGTNPLAARHNAEGMQAYDQRQWESAKQHFAAALQSSPSLAEAHYNLGMVLYRMGAEGDARPHFMRAADLAPGNEVIWSSPPFSGVTIPDKSSHSLDAAVGHKDSH